jgi:RPA family protein
MLPVNVIKDVEKGNDSSGSYVVYKSAKIYRMHLVGSIAVIEINPETKGGYLILDDTFSSILVHFQSSMFKDIDTFRKGDLVEVIGDIDTYNDTVTLSMSNIKKINLSRYCLNKIESIKNMQLIK